MSDAPTGDEMATAELIAKVEEMRSALMQTAAERHKLNGVMGNTLLEVGNRLLATDASITRLSAQVTDVAGTLSKLSDRLLGNATMQTIGLVAEVDAMRKDVDGLKTDRFRIITIVSTITGIGALVSWVSTHWPWGKP